LGKVVAHVRERLFAQRTRVVLLGVLVEAWGKKGSKTGREEAKGRAGVSIW
jgi:hypothetical protein